MHTVAPNWASTGSGVLAGPPDPVNSRAESAAGGTRGQACPLRPDRDGPVDTHATGERLNDKIVMRAGPSRPAGLWRQAGLLLHNLLAKGCNRLCDSAVTDQDRAPIAC